MSPVLRRQLLTVAILLTAYCGERLAAAASVTYKFADQAPSYRYVSGDLICEVEAFLQGFVTVSTDDETDEATLQFVDVTLNSPRTLLFGMPYEYGEGHSCRIFAESLHGSALAAFMPGIDSAIAGMQVTPTTLEYGPSLTDDGRYMREFTLVSLDRLTGSSIFYGEDGSNFFIDASLIAVPEPETAFSMAASEFAIAGLRRRWREPAKRRAV
jgi:hypothetical protein